MTPRIMMQVAAAGIAATATGVMAIAVPHALWTNASFTAMALFILSLLLPAFVRMSTFDESSNDAALIAMWGPLATLYGLLLILSGGALALELASMSRLSWILDVMWAGALVTGYSSLHAASAVVNAAAVQTFPPTEDDRLRWFAALSLMASQASQDAMQTQLEGLAERVRFAADDHGQRRAPQNAEISALLSRIERSLGNPEESRLLMRSTATLLEQRELSLRDSRR